MAEKSFQSLILDHEAFCTAQLRVTDSALCSSSSAPHSSVVLSLCLWIVAVQSLTCVRLCDPMDGSTPDFPVLYCLPEFAQTRVHQVSNAIQLSHPLLPLSPSALNLS